ncbi:MAG TPA: hypothetical protein VFJ58_01525 [Armatimonadota bacterium]|nr:hypothetical protein [Armatimonadota bacterium]
MKKFQKWLPSVLIVLGTAVFLSLTLRGLGPSGSGVPAMLSYQSAWMSAPAIHAIGTIRETHGAHTTTSQFELWETRGVDRRLLVSAPGAETLIVVTDGKAWKRAGNGPVETLEPNRADLFPIPDPYATDATFYRTARRWTRSGHETINGASFQRIDGQAKGARFIFDLDPSTHLPRRVRINETPLPNALPASWVISFDRIDTPRSLAPGPFLKP